MRPSNLAIWLFAFASPMFGLAVCASGQSAPLVATGRVQGVVRDSTGPALEGVDVRIVLQPSAVAVSDARGRYAIRNLPPGTYVIVARRVGFRPDIAEAPLESRMTLDVDFELVRGVKAAENMGRSRSHSLGAHPGRRLS